MTDENENTFEEDPALEEELENIDDSDEESEDVEAAEEPEEELEAEEPEEDPEPEAEPAGDGQWIGNRAVDIDVDGVKVKIRRDGVVKHPLPDELAEKLEAVGTIRKADS